MYVFRTVGGADLRYTLTFDEADYANISFFAANRKDILFHLSLRKKTGLAVVNSRQRGKWGEERAVEVDLAPTGDDIRIGFEEAMVTVWLNGHQIFAHDKEFPQLQDVQHLNYSGGIATESLTIGGAANKNRTGVGELELGDFLDVRGWAIDPGLAQQDIQLDIDGLDERIASSIFARPNLAARYKMLNDSLGVYATLPGRIWEALPEGKESLSLQLVSNGVRCGTPLEVTRSEVIARLVRRLNDIDFQEDTFDVLLAVEHVRYARLWPDLPEDVRVTLSEAASLYGVSNYMRHLDTDDAEVPAPQVPPIDPQEVLITLVRDGFGRAARDPGHTRLIDILAAQLEQFPLSPKAEAQLFLAVTEAFCNANCFEDLYEFAIVRRTQPYEPSGHSWHDSSILPFLCLEGRLSQVCEVIWGLSETAPEQGWVVTPALGWAVRNLLSEVVQGHDEKDIEDTIYAFMGYVNTRSPNYWERTPCAALIEVAVEMVLGEVFMTDYLIQEVTAFALANYGLSRRFWLRLDAVTKERNIVLNGPLHVGRQLFADLEARAEGGTNSIDRALTFFDTWNNPETDRFRRELLGTETLDTVSSSGTDLVERLQRHGMSPGDAILRTLARPSSKLEPNSETVSVAREAIRKRYENIPKAPYYDIQFRVSRRMTEILTALQTGPRRDTEAVLADLVPLLKDLPVLCSQRSRYLGLGLGLSLLNGLLRTGYDEVANHVLAHVSRLRAQVDAKAGQMFHSTVVQSALIALCHKDLKDHVLARAALALFPKFRPPMQIGEQSPDYPGGAADLGGALFDCIVIVFSCQPFLDTRVEAMRKGWLAQLEKLGVPYVVVVGDGDGRQEGDVVYLDAPDDYEGLPQKTLAAVQWVAENTPYGHMLKIDDDCFLDAGEFFHSLSYKKFDFYGRVIWRHLGGMDRSWHFEKSVSARGRKELDKSPEPSVYCDGGSGYVLSRHAMQTIVDFSTKPEGKRLIASTFMEDKLVGDLLALGDVRPEQEDYYIAVQRRTHSEAVPVSRWENGFYAGPLSPTKLVHLDSDKLQAPALGELGKARLWPRKIWPTHRKARLCADTNLLELVSPEDKLERLNAEPLAVVACLRNEMFMLPSFLAHYRKLGVKAFLIADNCSDDGSLEYLLEQPDVALFSADTQYSESHYGVAWQMAMVSNLRVGRWSLMADADELLVYPGYEKTALPKLLAGRKWRDVDAARIYMLDMYPKGPLSEATFEQGDPFQDAGYVEKEPFLRASTGRGAYSDSSTVTSAVRHRLLPRSRPELFVAQKYALLRYMPWMRPSAGLHYVADLRVAKQEMVFAHFKYNAHFRQKALDEVARGQHFNDAEEYRKYLALMSEGREVIYDPELSVHWKECAEIRSILKG